MNLTRQEISKENCAILVEGYMDVIGLYQGGVRNVSASLGTALTESQARLLKRYTKNVVLSYDADDAGRAAALRGIEILNSQKCRVKVLHEESPGSAGRGCRITSGAGNCRESATETYRRNSTAVARLKWRVKSSPAVQRCTGRVNPTRSKTKTGL